MEEKKNNTINTSNWIIRGDQAKVDADILEKYMKDNGIKSRLDLTKDDYAEIEDAKQSRFAATRLHSLDGTVFPFAYGGSDMGAIYGKSPWTTPVDLYYSKTGKKKFIQSQGNIAAMKRGHKYEPDVIEWFMQRTHFKVDPFTFQVSNKKWAHAVANIDGLVTTNEGIGIFEAKTTSAENFKRVQEWRKGIVPIYYQMQCWFYMAVLEIPFSWICCAWGLGPESIAYYRIERLPEDKERLFMEYAEQFVEDCANGIVPAMGDSKPDLIIKSLSETVGITDENDIVEFGAEFEDKFIKYKELTAEIEILDNEIKDFRKEKEAKKKELTAEVEKLEASFAEKLFDHSKGFFESDTLSVYLNFGYKTKNAKFDKALCETNYPEIFKEVYYKPISEERKMKVSIFSKTQK